VAEPVAAVAVVKVAPSATMTAETVAVEEEVLAPAVPQASVAALGEDRSVCGLLAGRRSQRPQRRSMLDSAVQEALVERVEAAEPERVAVLAPTARTAVRQEPVAVAVVVPVVVAVAAAAAVLAVPAMPSTELARFP
jgi:hypothetical protein